MDWYSTIAKRMVHPLWAVKDGEKHLRLWKELEKSQFYSSIELQELRLRRLKRMLRHANRNSPFYRERFLKAGFDPEDVRELSDIEYLPMLTKEDIQGHASEMRAANFTDAALLPDRTGGSTGKPLKYWRDRQRFDYLKAAAMRHDRWAGYEVGDKMAVVWGNRHDFSRAQEFKSRVRNLLLDRKLVLDSSSMTDATMLEFAEALRKFKPKVMLAYANSCAEFASFLLQKGIQDIRVRSVITSAEMLQESERETIEKALGCRVFNRYGCREVGLIASECEYHQGMHINAESLIVEFVRDGKTCSPGEQGDVVITDLLNFGMPFLRYRIEDVGVPSSKMCPCGRGLPLMEMVGGRVTDFLVAPDGRRVSGASLTIYLVANTPGVKQAQIIQEVPDCLRLKIVRGSEYTEDSIVYIRRKVEEFFGTQMAIAFEYVDEIAKEPSGKYRFSICRIKN
jgi:phenylacetate-CoA ligase